VVAAAKPSTGSPWKFSSGINVVTLTGNAHKPVTSTWQQPQPQKIGWKPSTGSPWKFASGINVVTLTGNAHKPVTSTWQQPQPQKIGWTPGVPARAHAHAPTVAPTPPAVTQNAVAVREVTLTVKMCPTYSDVLCLDASVTVPGGSTMAAIRAIIDREIAPHMALSNAEVATVMQGGYQFLTTDDVTVYGAQEGTKDASSCLVSHQSRWYIVLVPQQQHQQQQHQQQQQQHQQQFLPKQILPKQIPKQPMRQEQTGGDQMYCNAGHAMEETSFADGAYAQRGWRCDLCGGGSGWPNALERRPARQRWCCKMCTVDYCFSCRKSANEAAGGALSGSGGGGGTAALNTESKSCASGARMASDKYGSYHTVARNSLRYGRPAGTGQMRAPCPPAPSVLHGRQLNCA
jgi:hypothetical protein